MLLGGPFCAQAQIAVTRNGKPQARIVVMRETPVNRTAAGLLQRFVEESSGARLPIVDGAAPGGATSCWMRATRPD